MTSFNFREYLQWFDRSIGATKPGKEVLLLMDNFPAHFAAVETLKTSPISSKRVRIEWLCHGLKDCP